MLPSSSSQLARYGQISHYKKFWLLQTQLESSSKQEQSSTSSSTSLSLGGSAMCAAATVPGSSHQLIQKESSKAISSLVATHHHHLMNGDAHLAIMTPQYGICLTGNSSSNNINCSSRVLNAGPTLASYCPSSMEPASCAASPFFSNMPRYPTAASSSQAVDSPRLSLAVNCENVSDAIKFAHRRPYSRSSLLPHSDQLQQMIESPGSEEPTLSESYSEEDKPSCNSANPQTLSAAADHLMMGHQHHVVSQLQCTNPPIQGTAPLPSSGHLRTCTLCGTTRTPLWRSGPDGPKSLCNACGIRVKKTKRSEAALQATSGSSPSPSTLIAVKGDLKRKLSSGAHRHPAVQKKQRRTSFLISPKYIPKQDLLGYNEEVGGSWDTAVPKLGHVRGNYALAEDVEQAAVLLMALSCGLVLS